MADNEQELLSEKELQLLGQSYEEADHSSGGVSLNEYLLKAQVAKLKAMGYGQKDEKAELPKLVLPMHIGEKATVGIIAKEYHRVAQQDMLKAGFHKDKEERC